MHTTGWAQLIDGFSSPPCPKNEEIKSFYKICENEFLRQKKYFESLKETNLGGPPDPTFLFGDLIQSDSNDQISNLAKNIVRKSNKPENMKNSSFSNEKNSFLPNFVVIIDEQRKVCFPYNVTSEEHQFSKSCFVNFKQRNSA